MSRGVIMGCTVGWQSKEFIEIKNNPRSGEAYPAGVFVFKEVFRWIKEIFKKLVYKEFA